MPASNNPIVGELWRGDGIESIHRGAWVLVDTDSNVLDGHGEPTKQIYARSSTKSMQAMALFESGAARDLALTNAEVAVAVSSHNGESIHVEATRSILAKAGLTEDDLRCGPELPMGGTPRDAIAARVTNNCSGKHAGFLAAAVSFGEDPAQYLEPTAKVQTCVHEAVLEITGANPADVSTALDGCSAPTFKLPLAALATGLARVANPGSLSAERRSACRQITNAAKTHPELVAGTARPRFDTDILRATNGRIFAKGGAEGCQTLGIVGGALGFAAKIDDGSPRSLYRLTIAVLSGLGLLDEHELAQLGSWIDPVRRNHDGLDIGRHTIRQDALP